MPMKRLLTVYLFLNLTTVLFSQGYTNANVQHNITVLNTGAISHGAGVSFYDFNKDGFDDLTYCTASDSLIFYQSDGTTFTRVEIIPNPQTLDMRQATWVDYDNDGDADVLVTRSRNVGNNTRLWRNDGWPNFTDVTPTLNMPNFGGVRAYGQAWGDYDRDGWLDVYITNYNLTGGITNWLFHNNGNGTFTEVGASAGVSNGSLLSFQAKFWDFNEDGWLDLYVINDLNQPSAMYYNNGDGTFTDVSVATGTNLMIEAMCISVDDYENDGDWDIYVTNVAEGNKLLRNENGVFSDYAPEAGLELNRMSWGSTWVDYDNDGDNDMHIVTTHGPNNQNPFMINNGDNTFTENNSIGFEGDITNAYSNAKGDFNNDGFYDLTHSTVGSQNTYRFWQNNGVGGNWVKVDLTGTLSNRDAIGSLVEYWVDGIKKRYITSAGGGFLSQSAHTEILGIGISEQIDSLRITWPLGFQETHYNLLAGQRYDFTEGQTVVAEIASTTGTSVICDSLVLTVGSWQTYSWNDESTNDSLIVYAPGIYEVTVTNSFGIQTSASFEVVQGLFASPEASITNLLCFQDSTGSISLSNVSEENFMTTWNDQESGLVRDSLSAGTYTIQFTSNDGCINSFTYEVNEPQPLSLVLETDSVWCASGDDGAATLFISGGTPEYFIDWNDENPSALEAGIYTVQVTDINGCIKDSTFEIFEPQPLEITNVEITDAENGANGIIHVNVIGGTPPLSFLWSNGDEDATAEGLAQGLYSLSILDANNCSLTVEYPVIDVSVNEFESARVLLYPNPAHQLCSISTDFSSLDKVEVIDVSGRVVSIMHEVNPSFQMDVSTLHNGMYSLRIYGDGTIAVIRFVIE